MSLLAFGLNHRRAPISVLERAALDETSLSSIIAAATASPRICALEDWACNRKDEKSVVPSGWRTDPVTVPPFSLTIAAVLSSSE